MRLALLMSLVWLAGCAGDRALRNSPDFKAGYSDGCATASLEGANKRGQSPIRDEAAYRANAAYHSGWGSGFGACHAATAAQAPMGDPLAMPRAP